MKGITILNEIQTCGVNQVWVLISSIILLIGWVMYSCSYITGFNYKLSVAGVILTFTGLASLLLFIILDQTIPTGEVQYEVTIDDSVSMQEFTKKYEIIEQRGEIYVIKEK